MIKKVKSALLSVICMCALHITGFGQFNDSVDHYISFAGTGNLNRTNTGSTYLLNNTVRFQVDKKKVSLNSMVGYVYGRNPQDKTNDDVLAIMNVDFLKNVQKFYYWALTGFEKSFSLKVDSRFQAGVGVGYIFANSAKANLEVSDGFLVETTDLSIEDKHGRTSYQAVRNSLRLKYRFLIKDILKIDGTNFCQPSLADFNDYILKLNTNVSVTLYKWLSFTTSFNYNRQNITSTENLLLTYGLRAEKYF